MKKIATALLILLVTLACSDSEKYYTEATFTISSGRGIPRNTQFYAFLKTTEDFLKEISLYTSNSSLRESSLDMSRSAISGIKYELTCYTSTSSVVFTMKVDDMWAPSEMTQWEYENGLEEAFADWLKRQSRQRGNWPVSSKYKTQIAIEY